MKNYPNIETVKTAAGYYTGYGKLCSVWRIRGKTGNWYVTPSPASAIQGVPFFASTLQEVSNKLNWS